MRSCSVEIRQDACNSDCHNGLGIRRIFDFEQLKYVAHHALARKPSKATTCETRLNEEPGLFLLSGPHRVEELADFELQAIAVAGK